MLAAYNKVQQLISSPSGETEELAQQETDASATPANLLAAQMQAALDCEGIIFSTRVQQLLTRCRSLVDDVAQMHQVRFCCDSVAVCSR